jgi:hypothetical protein
MRRALPALLILAFAAPAWADGTIATASGRPAPASASLPPPLDEAAPADDSGPAPPRMGPCGPVRATADGKPDQSIHGEVGLGVGTGGYREMDFAACKPIGNDGGAIAVNIEQSQGDWGRRR